jgi:hypothetical protein
MVVLCGVFGKEREKQLEMCSYLLRTVLWPNPLAAYTSVYSKLTRSELESRCVCRVTYAVTYAETLLANAVLRLGELQSAYFDRSGSWTRVPGRENR